MRRSALLCLAALAVVACESATSPSVPSKARASLSQATTRTKTDEWIPLALTSMNPCTGEAISISGREHIVQTLVIGATSATATLQLNLDDLSGVGSSGAKYHVNIAAHELEHQNLTAPYAYSLTINANGDFVSQGKGDNFSQHFTETVSYDGVHFSVTLSRDIEVCHG